MRNKDRGIIRKLFGMSLLIDSDKISLDHINQIQLIRNRIYGFIFLNAIEQQKGTKLERISSQ